MHGEKTFPFNFVPKIFQVVGIAKISAIMFAKLGSTLTTGLKGGSPEPCTRLAMGYCVLFTLLA